MRPVLERISLFFLLLLGQQLDDTVKNKFHIKIDALHLDQTLRVRLGAFAARAAGLAARWDGAEQNPEEGEEGAARDEAGTNQLELEGPDMRGHIALKYPRSIF